MEETHSYIPIRMEDEGAHAIAHTLEADGWVRVDWCVHDSTRTTYIYRSPARKKRRRGREMTLSQSYQDWMRAGKPC